MAKIHHAELKDLQKVYARAGNQFTRPNGKPFSGVDYTYWGCFRRRGVKSASREELLGELRARGVAV